MPNPVWDLIETRVRRRPSDPLVTYVDTEGQRTELSARTLSNNVAKAANALRDEAMLDAGDAVRLDIGWHWQRAVWLLASWTLGLDVTQRRGAIRITDLQQPDLDDSCWIVSRHPFGLPEPSLPPGTADAATLARLQPDAFLPDDIDAALAAVDAFGETLTIASALQRAGTLGVMHDLTAGARLAVREPFGADAWLWPTLVPLACDVSIVMLGDGVDAGAAAAAESARLL